MDKNKRVVDKKYSNGTSYAGEVNENSKRHGYGTMHFRDGKYDGHWANGRQDGTGRYVWNSGSTYDGEWREGRFHGTGVYRWPSGAMYSGEWKNGAKEGQGTFLWANSTKYSGQFLGDKKHGQGTYISGDGTVFYGEYVADMMEGMGTYIFPDGARYVGQFLHNDFHGRGAYTTADGTAYIGEFKDDQRHGSGVLKTPHLGTFLVRYQNGTCVEHKDLHSWLRELDCADLHNRFVSEQITFEVLSGFTESDLQSLGVTQLGRRKRLLEAIERLPRVLLPPAASAPPEQQQSSALNMRLANLDRQAVRMSIALDHGLTSPRQPKPLTQSKPPPPAPSGPPPELFQSYSSLGSFQSQTLTDDDIVLLEEDESTHHAIVALQDLQGGDTAYGEIPVLRGEAVADVLITEGSSGDSDEHARLPSHASVRGHALRGAAAAHSRLVSYSELQIEKAPIGRGVYGVVYRATWRGADVCVKILVAHLGQQEAAELVSEASMMVSVCHHPHVVAYVGLLNNRADPQAPYGLVTAFYSRGSLYDVLIRRREDVPWRLVVRMARDAASGIRHLHAEKVIHRDVAARNCLIDEGWRCAVTDFGLARVKAGAYLQSNNNFGPVSWMAPESLLEKRFSEASDAYAFGVLLWELVARDAPFKGESPFTIATKVLEGKRPEVPARCPKEFAAIMTQCWKREPLDRPSFSDIIDSLQEYYYVLDDTTKIW